MATFGSSHHSPSICAVSLNQLRLLVRGIHAPAPRPCQELGAGWPGRWPCTYRGNVPRFTDPSGASDGKLIRFRLAAESCPLQACQTALALRVDIPVLSLFCGAGGLDLGFERAGFQPMLALDSCEAAIATYNHNRQQLGPLARLADLSRVRATSVLKWWQERMGDEAPRGIVGGPPCQAFSVGNIHQFEADPRARLPLAYARILKRFNEHFGLDFFLFENVAGLGSKRHSEWLSLFTTEFKRAGFAEIQVFYLDAVRFGVPQRRRRMFIFGLNRQRHPRAHFKFPEGDETAVPIRDVIGGLIEPVRFARGSTRKVSDFHPNHWCMNPRSPRFTNGTLMAGKTVGRSLRRLSWDRPSWTAAYGHREVHVHPDGHRRLSVYEAMLLQGFPPGCSPEGYELLGSLSEQIRLVSDAVPPPVGYALAIAIAQTLNYELEPASGNRHSIESGHDEHCGRCGVHTLAPRSTNAYTTSSLPSVDG